MPDRVCSSCFGDEDLHQWHQDAQEDAAHKGARVPGTPLTSRFMPSNP